MFPGSNPRRCFVGRRRIGDGVDGPALVGEAARNRKPTGADRESSLVSNLNLVGAARDGASSSAGCSVSRALPVQTFSRNFMGDEGRSFGFGDQVLVPSHRGPLWSKAAVVSATEKSGQ